MILKQCSLSECNIPSRGKKNKKEAESHQKLQNENLIAKVKAGVYSYSGLGQMYGVWGLHKRLSCEVF
jgi:hypothetical protein